MRKKPPPPPPPMTSSSRITFSVAGNLLVFFLLLLTHPLSVPASGNSDARSTYIVHVYPSHKPSFSPTHRHWYSHTLRSLREEPTSPAARLVYSYSHAASGFAARLTAGQAAVLRGLPFVVDVVPDRRNRLHTTRSPQFLRLSPSSGLWPASNFASDVVVGVLDSGIYPYHRSFSGAALSRPPPSWRGACDSGPGFNASAACNGKLVGARFFYKGYEADAGRPVDETRESKSPLDTEGHGTHTASTAAGSAVAGAGFYRYARGEARGVATGARIASYKVCWAQGCYDTDILAAIDAAIADGVDVISISIGVERWKPPPFYRDFIAIGAFRAIRHGVVVSTSAGNSGPDDESVLNVAPWILTVGASTIDREFPADVVLGDGSVYDGTSLYPGDPLNSTYFQLVYAGDCGSQYCIAGKLDRTKVAGKIVLCDRGENEDVEKGYAVQLAAGAGMIVANTADVIEELNADAHIIPATTVSQAAGDKIRGYIKSQPLSKAMINFRGTVTGTSPPSPKVAVFSSRGPNYRAPAILKPDVIAPGVNILAAWPASEAPTDLESDSRRVEFNIMSGTSMSCPHVSGIVALLREAHPKWSPAAIKSALMTTAYNEDSSGETIKDLYTGKESTPFARGAGHVDPNRALDPGLVYDSKPDDYIAFLCAMGYSAERIAVFTNDTVDCSAVAMASAGDLNYPAFAVIFTSKTKAITYRRVVRNVGGPANAVYKAKISSPPGVTVTVKPSKLVFKALDENLSYEIAFTSSSTPAAAGLHAFGSISWTDGTHDVRSPIAVSWSDNSVSSI